MKWLLTLVLILGLWVCSQAESRPDIVVVVLPDGQNPDSVISSVAPYEQPWMTIYGYTSNIDRDGMIACLLSGEYPQTNGYLGVGSDLYPERFQWVHRLKDGGYEVYLDSDSAFWDQASVRTRLGVEKAGFMTLKEEMGPRFLLIDVAGGESVEAMASFFGSANADTFWIILSRKNSLSERINFTFRGPGMELFVPQTDYPQVVDIPANVCAWTGLEPGGFLHGRLWNEKRVPERMVHYFRYWPHLSDGETPAHFGVRRGCERLTYYYGVDFLERGEAAVDYDDFVRKVTVNQTEPYWEYTCENSDGTISKNLFADPKHAEAIRILEKTLWEVRLTQGEGDRNFPHIEEILYGDED
jgi:hypothetical protein